MNTFKFLKMILIALAFYFCVNGPGVAKQNDYVSVVFLHGWKVSEKIVKGGILFRLDPGWKTYWRSPGPNGVKPVFEWSNSKNIANVVFEWPTPKIIKEFDIFTIGYKEFLLLPVTIYKRKTSKKTNLNLDITFGICSNICRYEKVNLNHNFDSSKDSNSRILIQKAIDSLPSKTHKKYIKRVECEISLLENDPHLIHTVHLLKKPKTKPAVLLEYMSNLLTFNNTNTLDTEKIVTTLAPLKDVYFDTSVIEREKITATIILEEQGLEVTGCI